MRRKQRPGGGLCSWGRYGSPPHPYPFPAPQPEEWSVCVCTGECQISGPEGPPCKWFKPPRGRNPTLGWGTTSAPQQSTFSSPGASAPLRSSATLPSPHGRPSPVTPAPSFSLWEPQALAFRVFCGAGLPLLPPSPAPGAGRGGSDKGDPPPPAPPPLGPLRWGWTLCVPGGPRGECSPAWRRFKYQGGGGDCGSAWWLEQRGVERCK